MLIDIQKFIKTERPGWEELEAIIVSLEKHPLASLSLNEVRRFHYLYERVSSDLAKLSTFATEPETRRYLESLVARAYGQIHETRQKPDLTMPWKWLSRTFPRTFRRHIKAFYLSVAVTIVGTAFGGMLMAVDPTTKQYLMPFPGLNDSPSERVAQEEERAREASGKSDPLEGHKGTGAAWYMKNNISVSIMTMALGATWGIGTIVELFYNGVILGAVCVEYVMDGQTKFLVGWLLPHGSTEIPAILIAGQAGFILAGAMIGWGQRLNLRQRLRRCARDLVTIIGGVALLLVWAGFIEAFLSQYHEPIIMYSHKIAFGLVELILLTLYLTLVGRPGKDDDADEAGVLRKVESKPEPAQ